MRKKLLLEALYGDDIYDDKQALRLCDTMRAMEHINDKYLRYMRALRCRYSGKRGEKLKSYAEVGETIKNKRTGAPLSSQRAWQMCKMATRWLQHPHRKRYILTGADTP